MNLIWLILIMSGILTAAATGGATDLTRGLMEAAGDAVTFTIELTGALMLWSGLMRVAVESGLDRKLAVVLTPLLRRLFPGIPKAHPAFSYISLAVSANLLGLGNASTPLGIKAMEEMQRLNRQKDAATDAMCTLLAITTSSVTLIPATVIAMRSTAGSANPSEIIATTLIATAASTTVALVADRIFRAVSRRRRG